MDTPDCRDLPNDTLFQIEWSIARRADQLLRGCRDASPPAGECWMLAEREVWDQVPISAEGAAEPPPLAP